MSHTIRPSRLFPLLLSLVLFVGIGCALYTLIQEGAHQKTPATLTAIEQSRIDTLKADIATREALLTEDPCTLKQRLNLLTYMPATPPHSTEPAAPPPAQSQPPAPPAAAIDHQDAIEKATVFIVNLQFNNISTGTGFFITKDVILTNAHVVENAKDVFILNKLLGTPLKATVVVLNNTNGRDYALLQVPVQKNMIPVQFRTDAKRAERIETYGYPHAISVGDPKYERVLKGQSIEAPDVVYSDGAIATILDRKPRLIAHTAPLSQGNSGGPLVDISGKVIGINSMISPDEASYRQTSLSHHAEDIVAFLKEHAINLP